MSVLRSIYQGAVAAGWQPFDCQHGEQRWMPKESLAFCRPETPYCGIIFARPDARMSMNDILDFQIRSLPHGLRVCWLLDHVPNVKFRHVAMVRLIDEEYVKMPGERPMLVAEFVEQALLDWPEFSDRLTGKTAAPQLYPPANRRQGQFRLAS